MGVAHRLGLSVALIVSASFTEACATSAPRRGGTPLALEADALRRELAARAGSEAASALPVPFEVPADAIALARRQVMRAPYGRDRLERLVDLLRRDPPEGFGLAYLGSRTATASEALAAGEGNCISLASVLIGLARGLGWQAYYAEAGEPRQGDDLPDLAEGLGVLVDHMVVVLVAEGEQVVVDFLGVVAGHPLQIIDDLQAAAHFQNNRAFEGIVNAQRAGRPVPWETVAGGFELATRIDPHSARAWNNLGIALARSGRLGDARRAYLRARRLDPHLASPERNLRVLRTRVSAAEGPAPDPFVGEAIEAE